MRTEEVFVESAGVRKPCHIQPVTGNRLKKLFAVSRSFSCRPDHHSAKAGVPRISTLVEHRRARGETMAAPMIGVSMMQNAATMAAAIIDAHFIGDQASPALR